MKQLHFGFTLLEVLVVTAIIGLLSSAIFINFNVAKRQADDDALKGQLPQIQLALETFRTQNGYYPGKEETDYSGNQCSGGTCEYASDLLGTTPFVPFLINQGHIPALPNDDNFATGCVFRYLVSQSTGDSYKLVAEECVQEETVTVTNEFARCPSVCPATGACDPNETNPNFSTSYGIYKGAGQQCE